MLHCIIPHYNVVHHPILHYTILHYTTLYYTILYYTTLYYTIGERNFHVFYQVIAGASDKKKWRLKDMESYKYIMQSSETEVSECYNVIYYFML